MTLNWTESSVQVETGISLTHLPVYTLQTVAWLDLYWLFVIYNNPGGKKGANKGYQQRILSLSIIWSVWKRCWGSIYRVSQKNVQIECCWSQGVQAPSPVVGTTWAWKVFFWSFLNKTKQDQAPRSHVHGKIWPYSAQFCSISAFFWDTL